MRKYWITAPSKRYSLHRHDGAVVLAPISLDTDVVQVYVMDPNSPLVSMTVPTHQLAPWHSRPPVGHQHCYCQRQAA